MAQGRDLIDRVSEAMRETCAEVIEPRFEALATVEVRTKEAGELVTVADVEAERLLTRRLGSLLPGAAVVGEEAWSTRPELLLALGSERAWLIDPLDGTANFVEGGEDWAVMVALCEHGRSVVSWIWQPATAAMYVAEAGQGAVRNDERLSGQGPPANPALWRGAVLTRFLPAEIAAEIDSRRGRFAAVGPGRRCAGIDYPALVEGELDFLLFWRTLPWDHAPGVLLLEEAGGAARRPTGSTYRPTDPGSGLFATSDSSMWTLGRNALIPSAMMSR